ncbi:MAG: hypothetical protein F9K47_15860 [Burkholderiales bacterium]|nr:MAG: hypothetical protein F9K47_15860 [Burkholderiales bacterium]
MPRSAQIFWLLVVSLCGATLWFSAGIGAQRATLGEAKVGLQTGDLVTLGTIVDGDTLQVKKEGKDAGLVRLVGITAFSTRTEKDAAAEFGRAAETTLRSLAAGRPVRLLLNTPPTDRFGRTLATLYADEQDLGLELVRRGLVLVYPVHPFPAMSQYAQEQAAARRDRRGLWAHPKATERAEALLAEWRLRAP